MGNEFPVFTVEELVKQGVLNKPLDGNHGGIHPKGRDFVDTGIPFIMASDMKSGGIDTVNCKFITKEQASRLRKGFAVTGDVLLSHKATIGRTAIVDPIDTDYIMLTPQVTYYRVKKHNTLNNLYLKFYFDSAPFQNLLNQWAGGGSTRAYLGITGQLKLPIVLPDIETQNLIAEALGTLDDKIELNRQINKTLEAMAQALFKSWFVDFDPVIDNALAAGNEIPEALQQRAEKRKALGDQRKPLPPEIQSLFPGRFVFTEEMGWVPEGWLSDVVKSLAEVTDYVANGSFAALKENVTLYDQPDYALYVRTTDFKNGFNREKAKYVDEASYRFLSKSRLNGSEVIISNVGDTGTVFRPPSWLGLPMTLGSNAIALKAESMGRFFEFYFQSELGQHQIDGIVGGSAQPKFNKTDFRALRIYFGSDQIVKAFGQLIEPIAAKQAMSLSNKNLLESVRDNLLPKLLSGKLRIPDAEKQVAEVL